MRVILEAIAGPHIKKRIVMPGYQKGTFGRTEWADYQFPDDPLMSSQHFSLECVGSACVLRDLGSTNGTYLNDERVVEGPVVTGSIIRAGRTRIVVTLEEGVASPKAPAAPTRAAPTANQGGTEPDLQRPPAPPRVPERPPRVPPRGAAQSPPRPPAHVPPRPAPRGPSKSAPSADQKALGDDDPVVRRNALLAAAWTGRRWLLEHCRGLCSPPLPEHWEALLLLAILGEPADLARILAIGRAAELGPKRFEVLGAFGHPEVVNDLIVGIGNADAAIAVAAGKAFTKITGVDISSEAESASTSDQSPPAESEQGVVEGTALPSAEVAVREWRKLKGKFSAGQRRRPTRSTWNRASKPA
jgi:FHA domain